MLNWIKCFLKSPKQENISPTGFFFFFFFYIFVNECLHNKDVVCSLFSKEKSNLTLRDVAATQIQFNSLIEAAVK